MKKISLKLVYKTLLLSCLITPFSCKKFLEEKPKTAVDVSNAYRMYTMLMPLLLAYTVV